MRRNWIKLYVEQILQGSMIEELLPDERWVWIGLLLLAGRSNEEGLIYLRKDKGYSDEVLAEILGCEIELFQRAKEKCIAFNKIKMLKNNVIKIVNWHKYQSEYQRQKPYRCNQSYRKSDSVEGEREGEEEKKKTIVESQKQDSAIQLVYDFYIWGFSKNPKTYQLTPKRKQKIQARLKEFEDQKYLLWAVYSISQSSFHLGENEGKKKYIELDEHIFRGQEQTERWVREFEEKKYYQAFEKAFNKFKEREK